MNKQLHLFLVLFLAACASKNSADELYRMGLKYFDEKEYLHALQLFDEAIQADENYAMAYLKRAQVHLIKDDYESAYYDLNRFLEFDTLVSLGYIQRAVIRYRVTDYYGALGDCNKAIEADPNSVEALQLRSRILMQFGNNPGAYDDLSQAISLNGKDQKSYLLRGDVYMRMADTDAACTDYSKAAELGSMQAYKRLVDYCSQPGTTEETAVVEKPVTRTVVKEKVAIKEVEAKEKKKAAPETAASLSPLDKWHRMPDIRSNIYQINTIVIHRDIVKDQPMEWGEMGPLDHAYLLVKQKDNMIFHLQYIVDGENTYEGFYKYTGAEENNVTLYTRVDGDWDEHLRINKPLEFVLEHFQTDDRTTLEMVNYTRGLGAKLLF